MTPCASMLSRARLVKVVSKKGLSISICLPQTSFRRMGISRYRYLAVQMHHHFNTNPAVRSPAFALEHSFTKGIPRNASFCHRWTKEEKIHSPKTMAMVSPAFLCMAAITVRRFLGLPTGAFCFLHVSHIKVGHSMLCHRK